jgi:predicted site-specific integrase-resolvase
VDNTPDQNSPEAQLQRTLRIDDFARAADVCSKTVRRWIDAGRVEAVLLSPRTMRIPASELQRLGLLKSGA